MDYLQYFIVDDYGSSFTVLNLVINGLPSIPFLSVSQQAPSRSFKPCYKWITFNTIENELLKVFKAYRFKPCYKWITFNT